MDLFINTNPIVKPTKTELKKCNSTLVTYIRFQPIFEIYVRRRKKLEMSNEEIYIYIDHPRFKIIHKISFH